MERILFRMGGSGVIPLKLQATITRAISREKKVKVHFKNMRPVINLKIELEGDINAIQSGINY